MKSHWFLLADCDGNERVVVWIVRRVGCNIILNKYMKYLMAKLFVIARNYEAFDPCLESFLASVPTLPYKLVHRCNFYGGSTKFMSLYSV